MNTEDEKDAISYSDKQHQVGGKEELRVRDAVNSKLEYECAKDEVKEADLDIDLIDLNQDLIDCSYVSSNLYPVPLPYDNQSQMIQMVNYYPQQHQQQPSPPSTSSPYFSSSSGYGMHQMSHHFQADSYQPTFTQSIPIGQTQSHINTRQTVHFSNTIPPNTPPITNTDSLSMLNEEVQLMKEQCFSPSKSTKPTPTPILDTNNSYTSNSAAYFLSPPTEPPPPIPSVTLLPQDTTPNELQYADMSPMTPNSLDSNSAGTSNHTNRRKKSVLERWKQPDVSKPPSFIAPSSAPGNEIRYYGTQRVVITKPNQF
mmetsp:Transcript_12462/g.17101  ORF Transcript_12462/g.17101 Transcript_12462/m.17101 type:complete len:313 (+) Transcript_12462:361-1299(+)